MSFFSPIPFSLQFGAFVGERFLIPFFFSLQGRVCGLFIVIYFKDGSCKIGVWPFSFLFFLFPFVSSILFDLYVCINLKDICNITHH